jgi:hypothetical protein
MNFKRLLGIVIVVCAVAVLAGSIGAGAAPTPAKHAIDLSTNTGVREYLRSVGISPRGVVIQRGAKNYAGPRCPGKRWTCTRSHRVVQIASHRGRNTFRCASVRCVVVQYAKSALAVSTTLPVNTAKCIKTKGLTQSCSITQSSATADNEAIVVEGQVAGAKSSGLTQTATYTATVRQTATGGLSVANGNRVCLLQSVNVDGSTTAKKGMPVTVTLNGLESASIVQDSLYGDNVVKNAKQVGTTWECDADGTRLTQSQTLSSIANGSARIEQNQNATATAPNLLLDIKQNKTQTTPGDSLGENHAAFLQSSTLSAIAGTPVGPVIQKQATELGGLQATVNQFAHGISTSDPEQTEIQCEHAQIGSVPANTTCTTGPPPTYSLTQEQHGPMRKGGDPSVQGDNPDDTFIVTQTSQQANDTHEMQTNLIQGDCSTTGDCTVTQNTNINGTPSTNTESGQNVNTQTTCTGSDCESTGPTTTGDLTLLPNGLSVSNTDIGKFGVGGMRGGSGTGSITVTGVSARVFHAFLYWNGPTNSADPDANADVTFGGSPITGTNIGISGDNNWGFQNSQSYRADVTSLVTGNGTYSLADFTKLPDVDINGVALMVFYDNGNSGDDRNVVLWNGNDSNCLAGGVPQNWDETINDVPYNGGTASLDLIVGDGQSFTDNEVDINGSLFIAEGQNFEGNSVPPGLVGGLWDVKSFSGLESFLPFPSNDLHLTMTTTGSRDCLSLVVAAANVPVSAPVILAPATAAATAQKQSRLAPTRQQSSGVTGASHLGGVSR